MDFITKIDMRYAWYHFKNTLIKLIGMLVIAGGLTGISCINKVYYGWGSPNFEPTFYLELTVLTIALTFALVAIPFTEFAEFKNRRNADTWFSFPISRYKIAIIHYLNGLLDLFLILATSMIVVMIRSNLVDEITFKPSAFTSTFWTALLLCFVAYSFVSFAFIQGNTTFDGVALGFLYVFFPAICYNAFETYFYAANEYDFEKFEKFYKYTNYLNVVNLPSVVIEKYAELVNNGRKYYEPVLWTPILIWTAIGIICAVGAILFFAKNKTHKLGEVSDSPFGLKVMIPAWIYVLEVMSPYVGAGIAFTVVNYIAHIVYRRSIKLKLADYIKVAISFILAFLLPFIVKLIFKDEVFF